MHNRKCKKFTRERLAVALAPNVNNVSTCPQFKIQNAIEIAALQVSRGLHSANSGRIGSDAEILSTHGRCITSYIYIYQDMHESVHL